VKFSHTVRTVVILLVLPGLAMGQARLVATVERVTDRANHEVPYPTDLSRRIAGSNRAAENVIKSMLVRSGDAILTRTAHSHVRLVEADRHAFLYSNTLVTFDTGSVWLLGHGGAFIVNRLGKLTVVVEGLARLSVNSEVYLRVSGGQLLAYVVEGLVTLEAGGPVVTLRAGDVGRVAPNQAPVRSTLDARERAEVQKEVDLAREWIPEAPAPSPRPAPTPAPTAPSSRGGGGGTAAVLGVLLGGGAAATYFLTREKEGPPDTLPGPPDLVVVPASSGLCTTSGKSPSMIRVDNLGTGPAETSILAVSAPLSRIATQRFVVPPLARGQSAVVDVSQVTQLCRRTCNVTAMVDPDRLITESNEGNNVQSGACGPG
jgi:hypothetical protein